MPFVATLFAAAAFFYFQYTFTKFKVVDFSKLVFYEKQGIFHPSDDEYIVLLYNSKVDKFTNLAPKTQNLGENLAILAIDYHQNTSQNSADGITPISSGMNTLLKFSRIFGIDEVPVAFRIKKSSENSASKYAQDSKIQRIMK
ncbi:hypothetical protein [Helicobacter sp. 23-1045]